MLNKKLLLGASVATLSFFAISGTAQAQSCSQILPSRCFNADGDEVLMHNCTDGGLSIPPSNRNSCDNSCSWTNNNNFFGTGGCCFIAGTKIRMADGSEKNIEDIQAGDEVLGENKAVHIVKNITPAKLNDRQLISINSSDYFSTSDHVFKAVDSWVSANPELTTKNYADVVRQIGGPPLKMEVGTTLMTVNGNEKIATLDLKNDNADIDVYDLSVNGNHTYYANDFLVHNQHGGGVCFFAGTKILMADGTTKNIENINVGDLTANGKVYQKYARSYDHAFQMARQNGCMLFDGIFVTGFHVVKEGEKWVASYDAKDAMPVLPPKNDKLAYNLTTESRIIPVIGNSGLHYFSDELNNVNGISERSFKEMSFNTQKIA